MMTWMRAMTQSVSRWRLASFRHRLLWQMEDTCELLTSFSCLEFCDFSSSSTFLFLALALLARLLLLTSLSLLSVASLARAVALQFLAHSSRWGAPEDEKS